MINRRGNLPMAPLEEPADDSEYKIPNSQKHGLSSLLSGGTRG